VSDPRNPELERAVIETKSPDAYDVYADWLQSQGHPVGELIAVQRRFARTGDPSLSARADALIEELDLPNEDFATYGLKWGLFDWLRVENQDDQMDDDFDMNAEFTNHVAEALPGAPIAARLEALDLSMGTLDDAPAAHLAAHASAFSALKRLNVDDNFLFESTIRRLRAAFAGVEVASVRQKEISTQYPDMRYVSVAE
jgi:uncharacterized protein (TIGR02996 family)